MMALVGSNLKVKRGAHSIISIDHLAFPKGTLSMILGPNGAGKTTLMRTFMGFEGQEDHIHVDKRPLSSMSRLERARLMQWVPARTSIPFAFSVLDLILLGRFPHHLGFPGARDKDIALGAATACGVTPFISRTYHSLSSGEQARVNIARALAVEPHTLLLDEPCASLDIAAVHELLGYLKNICSLGTTVIMTHHDLYSVKPYCDYVVFLKSGGIVHSGPVAETFCRSSIADTFGFDITAATYQI